MSAPNIIWIFPDEWRHDAFGYRGNDIVRTPSIDALAARGAAFTAAHCESPVCQPSRASLLTTRYPSQHGLFDNDQHPQWAKGSFPSSDHPNYLHSLQNAGYHTAVMGKTHFRGSARGEARLEAYGFDETWEEFDKYSLWRYETPYTRHLKGLGLLEPWTEYVRSLLPWEARDGAVVPNPYHDPDKERWGPDPVVPTEHQLDAFLGREAVDFIRTYDRNEPFFLWWCPIGPHSPFDAPSDVADRYHPEDIPLGPQSIDGFPDNRWGEYLRWNHGHLRGHELTEAKIRDIGKYYYGLCEIIDRAVGAIVQALAESGRAENTWIFLSSDHGELLGDHGMLSKRVFFDSAVRVPQLVVPPAGQEAGITVDRMTQGIDLVATILDVAGAELPGDGVPARSLLPALTGQDVGRDVVYSEIAGFLMVATVDSKLVVHKESREPGALYHLAEDPHEVRNLIESEGPSAVPPALMAHVDDYLERFAGA